MQKLSLVLGVCLVSLAAFSAPVKNGGFEQVEDGLPVQWRFHCSNGCEATLVFDTEAKEEGAQSARLSSASEKAPHVFCGLAQDIGPLVPGIPYRISFRAKGRDAGVCWFGGGPDWKDRAVLPAGSFDWHTFSTEVKCPAGTTAYHFRINVDSATEALWIDDVQATPLVPEEQPAIEALAPGAAEVVPLFKNDAPTVDGAVADWPDAWFPLAGAEGRIDAAFQVAASAKQLLLAVRVRDDAPVQAGSPDALWQYDSIQISLDPLNEKTPSGYGPHDYEIGFGLVSGQPARWAWCRPEGGREDGLDAAEVAIVHEDGATVYEVGLPWEVVQPLVWQAGKGFGFNLCVNDRDTGKDRVAAEWTEGTVIAKQPKFYKTLVMTKGPWMQCSAAPATVLAGQPVQLKATVYLPHATEAVIRVGDVCERAWRFEAGLSQCTAYVADTSALPAGETVFAVKLKGEAVACEGEARVSVSTADGEALALIAEQEQRLPALKATLEAARAEGLAIHYPQSDLAIAERFCTYCRDDVNHGRYARALEVAQEVAVLLDQAEGEMRDNIAVPVLDVEQPVTIRDGSFWGTCRTGGKAEERPVFLTGYGHFPPVVADLPLFPSIGINVIQIEMGPRSLVFEDSVSTQAAEDFVVKALDRARENGVMVCLLASPHYFPDWAFAKWPDIHVPSGFLKNTVDAPQVRDVYERFLRALIGLVKDHPALHSICLSNEPVSLGSPGDPYRLPLWHAYIEAKHGTIAQLNELYGTEYASFDEAPHPKFAFDENPAALYDAVRFNQERFAEWHAWMAGIVHDVAPGLPCHAKVMALPNARGTVFWGTDPWDFAKLSQINGNDCYFMREREGAAWASHWIIQNMYYDLQRSMKKVPVFNTENHIIRDREEAFIPAEHIYAAIWQGAVHGQGGSATWAWQRTYDERSDFEGLILHRPACTAAMSRCALDLMRLSHEMAALQGIEPKVALLYSHAATIRDTRHVHKREQVYESLNFCGAPIGFVTDEQAAAGGLERYSCLIVPGTAASREAIEGMRQFKARGGRVLGYGDDVLSEDEYGRPVENPPIAKSLGNVRYAELRDVLAKQLRKAGIKPRVELKAPGGGMPYGVEWRSAERDGRVLLNMVNYTQKPMAVTLPRGTWQDRISGQPLESPITLAPDVPVLAKRR